MKKNQKIKGIVVPVSWDDDGNVLRISVHTTDEKEYLIEQSKIGIDLLSHVQSKIVAEGPVRRRLDGKTIINIKDFRLISDYNSDV
jgi:hypothetical protein